MFLPSIREILLPYHGVGGPRDDRHVVVCRVRGQREEELERKIDTLKYQKAAMSAEDYKTQLSSALLELARVQQELDK